MAKGFLNDEFGNVMNQVEAVPQPFKFVGQYGVMTEPNGFYYMRARYYDPKVGRFISEDPIGFEGGDVNLMVYVGNNPILLIDPLGLCSDNISPATRLAFGVSTIGVVTTEVFKIVAFDTAKAVISAYLPIPEAVGFVVDKTYTGYGVYKSADEFKSMGERIRTQIEDLREWWYTDKKYQGPIMYADP